MLQTEFMLRQLGATLEQIDCERDRIRREFFGSSAAWNHAAANIPASPQKQGRHWRILIALGRIVGIPQG